MPQFSIRDLIWLIVVIVMALVNVVLTYGWYRESFILDRMKHHHVNMLSEAISQSAQKDNAAEDAGYQFVEGENGLVLIPKAKDSE